MMHKPSLEPYKPVLSIIGASTKFVGDPVVNDSNVQCESQQSCLQQTEEIFEKNGEVLRV